MKKPGALALAVLFITNALHAAAPFGPATPEGGVFKMASIEAASPPEDLAPLRKIAAQSTILGLGEPDHGSHAFHSARAKIIRHLVESEGYRVVGFEAPWAPARRATDYAIRGKGTPEEAASSLYFEAWQDVEVVELLRWTRAFNVSHPLDPVYVFGFDMQVGDFDKALLADFLSKADPGLSASAGPALQKCFGLSDAAHPQAQLDGCVSLLDGLRKTFTANAAAYVAAAGAEALFQASTALKSLRAWQYEAFFLQTDPKQSTDAREPVMAELLSDLVDHYRPGAKAVLYAHNYHIANNREPFPFLDAKTMGTYLGERYGAAYAAIGMIGYSVRVNHAFFPPQLYPDPPVPDSADSVELALHNAGCAQALVSTTGSFLGADTKHELQDMGSPFNLTASKHYDLLLYVDVSPALIRHARPYAANFHGLVW